MLTRQNDLPKWEPLSRDCIKINFDMAFNKVHFRAGLGVVAKDMHGKVLVAQSKV